MTESDILELLSGHETDRIEITTSTNKTDKFSEAVCAFANDLPNHGQPGYLIIGLHDDKRPSGLTVTDELLRNLAALRSEGHILPLPALNISKVAMTGGEVAVVEVFPSDLPPVRYKGQVWVRVGPRKAIASEQEERRLSEKRAALARSFDASPITGASIEDISLSQFNAYRQETVDAGIIAANHRTTAEQLASLRLFDLGTTRPTAAGILMFGKNPRYFFSGAYIQYLRLPGVSLTERPSDQAEISGDLLGMLREIDSRIKVNIQTSLEAVSALREKMVPDYPEVAIRELLLNAVMHRDYQSNTPIRFYWFSDRVEIQSPGGFYGGVTAETMTRMNSYRNPILAEGMKSMGYVNRFGYGIQRAQDLLRANGNPPAEFEITENMFLAVIRRRIH